MPAVLEQELKRVAASLRMPVSNVVRAILEDAVTAVDVVGQRAEGEVNRVVDRLAEKRQRLRDFASAEEAAGQEAAGQEAAGQEAAGQEAAGQEAAGEETNEPLDGVLGFQPLILASNASCTVCGATLEAGTEAYVGLRDTPGPRVLIGPECLSKPDLE